MKFTIFYKSAIAVLALAVSIQSCVLVKTDTVKKDAVKTDIELHIAPHGKATATGSQNDPFASIEQARRYISQHKLNQTNKPINIKVKGGEYWMDSGVKFNKDDSGSASAKITYQNIAGETPVFRGAVSLDTSQLKALEDTLFIDKLTDKSAAQFIKVMDISHLSDVQLGSLSRQAWGIRTPDRIPPASLMINGERMDLARWPNADENSPYMTYRHFTPGQRPLKGYEKKVQKIIEKVSLAGDVTFTDVIDHGDHARNTPKGKGGTVKVAFDRMKHWQNIDQVYVEGVLASTWEWTYNRLASADINKRELTFAYPELNGIGRGNSVRLPHFHFENIPEELNAPGEYYIDRQKKRLYIYPPVTNEPLKLSLITLAEPLIDLNQTEHVTFDGLHFIEGRNIGINIIDGNHITIKNGRIADFIAGGIKADGKNHLIENNEVHGLGAFGIHILGGDKRTLEPGNHLVSNNHIHDFGWEVKSQQPGVFIDGVGHRISNNKIHDASHFAIRVRAANDVIIERNEIFDLPKYHFFDGGSLYVHSGRYPQARGVVIRENYFHDIPTNGIYPDNFSWGVNIHSNIFNRVGLFSNRSPVFVNGGGENRTFNNLMINSIEIYRQGTRPKDEYWKKYWEKAMKKFGGKKLAKSPHNKYPDFAQWLTKETEEEFYRPTSYVYDNVAINTDIKIIKEAKNQGVVDKSENLEFSGNILIDHDPGFKNMSEGDFQLSEDSEIFKKVPSFKAIDFAKIGRQLEPRP